MNNKNKLKPEKTNPKKTIKKKVAKVQNAQNSESGDIKKPVDSNTVKPVNNTESKSLPIKNTIKTRVKARVSEKTSKSNHVHKFPDVKKTRPIIQVKNLVKKYGKFIAVNNVSFEVKKGEIFGILGPNGAGKTTTLEIIETVIPKTSGQILIDGLNVDNYPEHIKNVIGIQLQSGGFFPRINLKETLEMYADIYNVKIDALKMLESVSLLEKAKSTPDQLSGGQRQRFSIITTLVADPQIIFLDEPTTGLDPQARRNLWDMIIGLKSRGKTIVITTHYMDEAEVLCDRIAIMDAGKILEINTVQNYIENLLSKGFVRPQPKLGATLEDVFLDLTGKFLRE
jgi:ABC-2 type transport system ATP-binding protein